MSTQDLPGISPLLLAHVCTPIRSPFAPSFPVHRGYFLFHFCLSFTGWVQRWLGHWWSPLLTLPQPMQSPGAEASCPWVLPAASTAQFADAGAVQAVLPNLQWQVIGSLWTLMWCLPLVLKCHMGCKLFPLGQELRGRKPQLPGEQGHLPLPLIKYGNSTCLLFVRREVPAEMHQFCLSSSQESLSIGAAWGKGLERERFSNVCLDEKKQTNPTFLTLHAAQGLSVNPE